MPQRFKIYEEWPEYDLAADIAPLFHPRRIEARSRGVHWNFGPLHFEYHVGDNEPAISSGPLRLITWQRITRTALPPRWHALWRSLRCIGYVPLQKDVDYTVSWSESARRYLKKWREASLAYEIAEVSYPEFEMAYRKSQVGKKLGLMMLSMVRSRLGSALSIRLIAARYRATGELEAGIAVMESPSSGVSYYHSGFYCETGGRDHAMAGLFDAWFAGSSRRGINYLHLGRFWKPGNPRSWKGFSEFKAKFGPTYITQPPTAWRLARKS